MSDLFSQQHYDDPATAPNIPINVTIEQNYPEPITYIEDGTDKTVKIGKPTTTISVVAYDRPNDQAQEWNFRFQAEDATITTRPLTPNEQTWLRNIGARP